MDQVDNNPKPTSKKCAERTCWLWFALLIVLVAIIGFIWRDQLSDLQLNNLLVQPSHETTKQLTKLQVDVAALQQSVTDLSQQLDELAYYNTDNFNYLALVEIEHVLVLALHQLQYQQNVPTALIAMETAATRLKSLTGMDVAAVHTQILTDIEALAAVTVVDYQKLNMMLLEMIQQTLVIKPLLEHDKYAAMPDHSTAESQQFSSRVWELLQGWVVIRKNDQPGEYAQPIEILRSMMALELRYARLAMLKKNEADFHAAINQLQSMLECFDLNDEEVISFRQALNEMAAIDFKIVLPDIDSSIESVRALMRSVE